MNMVRYSHVAATRLKNLGSMDIRLRDLSCATHVDFSGFQSFYSSQLEQLALACPNLQRLNLRDCYYSLKCLQGLQAIASHCHNLQGLNLLGIHMVPKDEDRIQLWEILSGLKLTYLAVQLCTYSKFTESLKKTDRLMKTDRLIKLFQKCLTIKGIRSDLCTSCLRTGTDVSDAFSCFPSLQFCYISGMEWVTAHTVVQDVINNCKKLNCVSFDLGYLSAFLNPAQSHYLQQLYINIRLTIVPDLFMSSVSTHGGLLHVYLFVQCLTIEGITSLVRNSPKLIKFYVLASVYDVDGRRMCLEGVNAKLKKMFSKRKLFHTGYYEIDEIRYEAPPWQAEDLFFELN